MTRMSYPSDLTDAQWQRIEPLIPAPKPGGRPRTVDLRDVLDAILYLVRSGCSWRQLPHDFPPWGTVHFYYRVFRLHGIWRKIHDRLRVQVRRNVRKKPVPRVGIIDSQSVKTTEKGGNAATMRARRSVAASVI